MADRLRVASLAVLAAVLVASAVGFTRAAFSSQAPTAANRFAAGTVRLGDNSSGTSLLSLADALPGATDAGCIRVVFDGTLPSTVRLFATVSGGLASHLVVTVTRGTETAPAFDACGGFTADSTDYIGAGPGIVYDGTLAGYPATYDAGIVDPTPWTTGAAASYRITATLANNPAAAGQNATATFRWEARNQ